MSKLLAAIAIPAALVCLPCTVFAQSTIFPPPPRDTGFSELLKPPVLRTAGPYFLTQPVRPGRYNRRPNDRQIDSVYRNHFKMDEVPIYYEDTKGRHTR